ncbi:hemerythrin domain-containing protein [Pedobacter sp. ASV1-7]|uniref:hemerythrin domain-containing protein n=1 Tax=Pedobacter sp. ASV1-7 TaxID=3145237 RepID=UPI0032E8F022
MNNKPLKRSQEMQILSRDHHFGLLFTWKIKQGINKKVDSLRMKDYVNFFWNQHLKDHFLDEEVLLFNRFSSEELCIQAKKDHQQIIDLIERVNAASQGDYAVYEKLFTFLDQHIRFEERVVFPHLEVIIPESVLTSIGHFLEKHHQDFVDDFKDEFWK